MSEVLPLTNEADVREDFIMPFLTCLGYRKGTQFDILREKNLIYPRQYLGRKKGNDPPLVGKADYILSILGVGRWVIEAKPPNKKISRNDIEQALTYARHPEVSAALVVLTNGVETHVYRSLASVEDGSLGRADTGDPTELASLLSPLVKPERFAARFTSKLGSLTGGIAPGYPDICEIISGSATYRVVDWHTNVPALQQQFVDVRESLLGYVSHVSGGSVRVIDGRIHAQTDWSMGNDKMESFAATIGLGKQLEFVSQAASLSIEEGSPSYFDAVMELSVPVGAQIISSPFDQWATALVRTSATVAARAKGHLDGNHLKGEFFTEYYFRFPDFPSIELYMEGSGDFDLRLDA